MDLPTPVIAHGDQNKSPLMGLGKAHCGVEKYFMSKKSRTETRALKHASIEITVVELLQRVEAAHVITKVGAEFINLAKTRGKVCNTCSYVNTLNGMLVEINEIAEELKYRIFYKCKK